MALSPQKISRSNKCCSKCDRQFKAGDVYISTLFADETDWKRLDRCESCPYEGDKSVLALWKITMPTSKSGVVLSENAIWQVLKKAEKDDELRAKPIIYILCLMMGRKRKIRMIGKMRKKGQEVNVFSNKSRGIHLESPVPILSPFAFSKLQEDLSDFFEGE